MNITIQELIDAPPGSPPNDLAELLDQHRAGKTPKELLEGFLYLAKEKAMAACGKRHSFDELFGEASMDVLTCLERLADPENEAFTLPAIEVEGYIKAELYHTAKHLRQFKNEGNPTVPKSTNVSRKKACKELYRAPQRVESWKSNGDGDNALTQNGLLEVQDRRQVIGEEDSGVYTPSRSNQASAEEDAMVSELLKTIAWTPQETDIVKMKIKHYTVKEICEHLGISEQTYHVAMSQMQQRIPKENAVAYAARRMCQEFTKRSIEQTAKESENGK